MFDLSWEDAPKKTRTAKKEEKFAGKAVLTLNALKTEGQKVVATMKLSKTAMNLLGLAGESFEPVDGTPCELIRFAKMKNPEGQLAGLAIANVTPMNEADRPKVPNRVSKKGSFADKKFYTELTEMFLLDSSVENHIELFVNPSINASVPVLEIGAPLVESSAPVAVEENVEA